jgi:hypothetical protein
VWVAPTRLSTEKCFDTDARAMPSCCVRTVTLHVPCLSRISRRSRALLRQRCEAPDRLAAQFQMKHTSIPKMEKYDGGASHGGRNMGR